MGCKKKKKKKWRRGKGSKKEDRRKRQNEGNERERFVKDYVLFIEGASFLFFPLLLLLFALALIGRVLAP